MKPKVRKLHAFHSPLGLIACAMCSSPLAAVNTYSGGTTIDEGVIKAGSASIFNTGNGMAVVINSAGTLDVNGKAVLISSFSGFTPGRWRFRPIGWRPTVESTSILEMCANSRKSS